MSTPDEDKTVRTGILAVRGWDIDRYRYRQREIYVYAYILPTVKAWIGIYIYIDRYIYIEYGEDGLSSPRGDILTLHTPERFLSEP